MPEWDTMSVALRLSTTVYCDCPQGVEEKQTDYEPLLENGE